MPPKRNPKLNVTKKQQTLIKKRLMQISLQVDDYVYNYKPISTRDAEAYINEVTGYQDKCTDDRSLQVIEKLQRCLKGIIEEQNECLALNDVTLAEDQPIDEDTAPLTQEIEAIDAVLKKIGTKKTSYVNVRENKPLHLSVNSQCGTQQIKHKNNDIDVLHRAISELSIQENDTLLMEKNNLESSQSVLAEFNDKDAITSDKAKKKVELAKMKFDNGVQAIVTRSKDQTKNNPISVSSKHLKKSMPVNDVSIEVVGSKRNTRKRKLLNVVSLANNIAEVRTTEFTADTQHEMLTIATKKKLGRPRKISRQPKKVTKQSKRKTKDNKNKTGLKNNTDDRIDNGVNKNTCEEKSGNIHLKTVLQNVENIITNHKTLKDFSEIHLSPDNSINLNDNRNTFIEKALRNRQVVANDLSWIENIRYVREISLEENIPSYYDDDFWNNLSLPNDWNESEFL